MRKILTVIQIISVVVLIGAYGVFAYMHWEEEQSIQVYQECRTLYQTGTTDNSAGNTVEDGQQDSKSR